MCVCVCVCVYLNHFALHQKLAQHCKSAILWLKKKLKKQRNDSKVHDISSLHIYWNTKFNHRGLEAGVHSWVPWLVSDQDCLAHFTGASWFFLQYLSYIALKSNFFKHRELLWTLKKPLIYSIQTCIENLCQKNVTQEKTSLYRYFHIRKLKIYYLIVW